MGDRALLGVGSHREWHDLSDGELRARLTQRGLRAEDAKTLVLRRDDVRAARQIHKVLSAGA